MKVEALPSGSYRIRKTYGKKTFTKTFDHKPKQREIVEWEHQLIEVANVDDGTMRFFIQNYIDSKRNVLSPSSIITYERLVNVISEEFLEIQLKDLTQLDVQTEINRYAKNHAPKSVKSLHGFIASVIGLFRPQMILRTTLPQKIEKGRYLPNEDDIKALLDATQGTDDHIAIQLGILSLRRSEICALDMEDLRGNELHIHANMVWNKGWIRKESPKSDAGNRTIYLPDELVAEIKENGHFYGYSPNKLLEHLHKYQKELGIPQFRFHDLRHYFASYASRYIPEADAMALGGWKSDHIFKRIYRESIKEKRKESAQNLISKMFS